MVIANNNGNLESILIVISIHHLGLYELLRINVGRNIEDHLLFHKNNQKQSKYSSKSSILLLLLTFIHTAINGYTLMHLQEVKIRSKNMHYILFTKI